MSALSRPSRLHAAQGELGAICIMLPARFFSFAVCYKTIYSALQNIDCFFEVRYASLELFPLHSELHVKKTRFDILIF